MEILWLSIVFYSIGLGLVLQLRPALMFHENGTWKEFGYQRSAGSESRHTLFPFWLFAIAWAFASYVLAAAITWTIASPAAGLAALGAMSSGMMASSNMRSSSNPLSYESEQMAQEEEESESESEDQVEVEVPVKKNRGRPRGTKTPRAGYYVIDPSSNDGGLHKYVYYGDSPPPDGHSIKMNGGTKNRNINLSF